MSVFRFCVSRLTSPGTGYVCASSSLCKQRALRVAGICHKNHMDPEVRAKKPAPWPWETKKYSWFHQWLRLDDTLKRFDENTKVVVVEGNVGSGKSKFAKELAAELGMRHFPEPSLDQIYVDKYGFDFRTLNYLLPEWGQAMDIKLFYMHPHHKQTPSFQIQMYKLRYWQYIDALAHLYNTGEGVVLERSPWSDMVFMETLHKFGYIPRDARDLYHKLRNITIWDLQRPHLVIYLDVPPEVAMERIKKRNIPYEVNSKVLTPEYLQKIDTVYKESLLPEMSRHAELLVYDWTKKTDMDLIIEDLEKLDYDQYVAHGEKMEDWRMFFRSDWHEQRRLYSNWKEDLFLKFILPTYDVPSLEIPFDVVDMRERVFDNYSRQYDSGWDPHYEGGYMKLLFKIKDNYRKNTEYGLWDPYYPKAFKW